MIIIYIFIFIFGLIIGSFINCLIYRLHEEKSMLGRSFCPKCKKQIAWYDNIPVLSFIILRGKCRQCHKKISWQYPIVEFAAGLLFVIAFFNNFEFRISNFESILNFEFLVNLARNWFIISVMAVIFVYDLRWYLILDKITLPAAALVFIMNLMLGYSLWNLAISGIIGGSFFLIQFVISRGKWIGGGDIRLGLLMGLALGWPMVLVAIFLAYFIGSIAGIGLIISGQKKWGSKIPLGIFLSTTTIITLFWGQQILNWYLNFFKF